MIPLLLVWPDYFDLCVVFSLYLALVAALLCVLAALVPDGVVYVH